MNRTFITQFVWFVALLQACACAKDPKFLKVFEKWNKKYSCFGDMRKLLQADRLDEMLDSWSNFSKKYTHGNSMDFGDFDSCLDFNHEKIQPQHCLVQYQYKKSSNRRIIPVLPNTTPLNYDWRSISGRFTGAICIPDTCTEQNVRDLMKEVLNGSDFMQSIDYDQSKYCKQSKITFEFDALIIISVVCLLVIVVLIVVGTLLTYWPSQSFFIKLFQCFSIRRNYKSLVSNDKSEIPCLDGIKAISTIGIFFLHSSLFRMVFPFYDGKELSALTNSRFSDVVMSLLIFMDTFLIISGLLLGRSMLRSERITLWKFYLQRYMRLTPLILVLVFYSAINIFVFKLIPRPYFHMESLMDDCRVYWWTMALHIQNFVNPKTMCIPHSWFASALFQLIIIAPLIHLALRNQKNIVKFLCYGCILFIGLLLRLMVFIPQKTYFDSKTAVVIEMSNDVVAYTYFTSYVRVISFFSGVLLAHILEQDNKINLCSNKKANTFFIKCCFYTSVFLIIANPFIYPAEKNLAIVYGLAWIVATNFVIFTCYKGQGGIVNWLLSLTFWKPIAKMGLTIYLVAPFFQGLLIVTKLQPWIRLTPIDIIIGFICDIAISSLPIVLIYVSIECSFTNLGKLLTSSSTSKKTRTEEKK